VCPSRKRVRNHMKRQGIEQDLLGRRNSNAEFAEFTEKGRRRNKCGPERNLPDGTEEGRSGLPSKERLGVNGVKTSGLSASKHRTE